ncbi:MAG: Oxidoreductase FAD/NAD(P)-binding protein [uncultured bacterium]|nr:MAG: Oxidoreductase FAD/NAD(P)-binding protein [uncultured bacterium]HBY73818.1 hypothetical protein [Candidatus Kerfeldbacteria bacterium]
MYRFAQIVALIGASLLFFQPILAARLPFIERIFGLDKLMRVHKWIGITAFSLIVMHGSVMLYYFRDSLSFIFTQPWYVLGPVTALIIDTIVLITLLRRRLKLPYHWWKRIHQCIYLALLTGFLHSFMVGSDLATGWLRYYWIILAGLMILAIAYRRIIIPLTTKYFQVKQHQIIAQNVHHATLAGKPFRYWPGQFMMVQFQANGISKEWHPFTISSAPSDPDLTVSMKESGDWTATLGKLSSGVPVKVEGPYGKFSYHFLPQDNYGYVFVAGGIGITPIRSMIRELCHESADRPITLLYNAKTMNDFAFKNEFDDLAKMHPNLKVVYITSQEKGQVRFGRVDQNCLQEEIHDITHQHYFICGPKPMMTAVRKMLRGFDVPKSHIHFEEFSLS